MDAIWREMGRGFPADRITQEAFDRDDGHLHRLVSLKPGEKAAAGDLRDYTQDLRFTEIQGELLVYVLPFCLEAWREDLRGADGYGGFVEHFYPALADRKIFELHLRPKQTAAVSDFMRRTILEEIDDQRGLAFEGSHARPYRWFRALATYGVLFADVELLWSDWWSVDTVGRAVAVVQYASCLMYPENENPVFAPWTGQRGGGPPCLWGFEGHLYEHRWLEANVEFLKRYLHASRVDEVLKRAAERLSGQPEQETATLIHEDFAQHVQVVKARCAALPARLATPRSKVRVVSCSGRVNVLGGAARTGYARKARREDLGEISVKGDGVDWGECGGELCAGAKGDAYGSARGAEARLRSYPPSCYWTNRIARAVKNTKLNRTNTATE